MTATPCRNDGKATAGSALVSILVLGDCTELSRVRGTDSWGNRCRVLHTTDPEFAGAQLQSHPVDLVIAYHDGRSAAALRVLERAKDLAPETSRLLLCEEAGLELLEAASCAGVMRVLVRPVPEVELLEALQAGVDHTLLARHGVPRLLPGDEGESALQRRLAREILPSLPRAVLRLDVRGRVVGANASAELILGRTATHLQGRSASDLGVPCRDALVHDGELQGSPSLCGSRDVSPICSWGEQRHILWSCSALQDAAGEHSGCEVSFVDITNRDELDINIFLAKHEIESIFDSITDPTFLVDRQQRIVRANRALSQYLDKPFPAILGHVCRDVLAGKGGERLCAGMSHVFRHGRRGREELDLGDGRIYKLHYFPIVRARRVRHVVVRYHEITAEKEMENRLLQAEKLASIGELSAGIAHEINNPVGFISWNINQLAGYIAEFRDFHEATRTLAQRALVGELAPLEAWRQCVETWADSDLPFALQDASDIVQECNQGVERVQKIVRDLRSYSHPATTEWETTDVHECLETALTIAASEIKHRCEVVREYGEISPIRGISQRIIQVFINLLVNAAQAMQEHGRITLRTRAAEEAVRIEVEDTGCGIPQPILNKIFDPFFTTKEVGEGTGLGLYLTRSIIEEHRGQIHATSRPGEGTCFAVTLPFDPDQSELQSPLTTE